MPSQLEQIRDQQRETWDKFSSGWKKWDELVLNWLAPVGQDLIRSAALEDDSNVLDVAAGTGEPGLTAATLVPKGMVTVTDLSDRMLEVAAENAGRRGRSSQLSIALQADSRRQGPLLDEPRVAATLRVKVEEV